jgi:hypothetical protein
MITDESLTKATLHKQTELCMSLLQDYDEAESDDEEGKNSLTSLFMSGLLRLYLTIQQQPELEETSVYQDFLQSSVILVARMQGYIVDYQMRINNLFPPDPDGDSPWPYACWIRSAFQAFLEMYHFTLEMDIREYMDLSFEDFDPESEDEVLEGFVCQHGPANADEIPVGMPRSHWWWWGEKVEAEAA